MSKFLDSTGVSTLWNKVKETLGNKLTLNTSIKQAGTVIPGLVGEQLVSSNFCGYDPDFGILLPIRSVRNGRCTYYPPALIAIGSAKDSDSGDIESPELEDYSGFIYNPSRGYLYLKDFAGNTDRIVWNEELKAEISKVNSQITTVQKSALKVWSGTLAQYNAITSKDSSTLYIIT